MGYCRIVKRRRNKSYVYSVFIVYSRVFLQTVYFQTLGTVFGGQLEVMYVFLCAGSVLLPHSLSRTLLHAHKHTHIQFNQIKYSTAVLNVKYSMYASGTNVFHQVGYRFLVRTFILFLSLMRDVFSFMRDIVAYFLQNNIHNILRDCSSQNKSKICRPSVSVVCIFLHIFVFQK